MAKTERADPAPEERRQFGDSSAAADVGDARTVAYVGLGANLGDAADTLRLALVQLGALPSTTLEAQSSFFLTEPVDAVGPIFVNAVARVSTRLAPDALLSALHTIEHRHGRQRPYLHAPRTLDLDLLLYGQIVMDTPNLTLPHPLMHERAFVLVPLLEIAPDAIVPGRGAASALLPHVLDQGVARLEP